MSLIFVALLFASVASAQDTIAIDRYEVDAACPDRSALEGALHARLSRDVIDETSERRVEIAITRGETALQASVEIDGAGRTIAGGTDCRELIDAVALVLALAIEEREADPEPVQSTAELEPALVQPTADPTPPDPPEPEEDDEADRIAAFGLRLGVVGGGVTDTPGIMAGARYGAYELRLRWHPESGRDVSRELFAADASACLEIGLNRQDFPIWFTLPVCPTLSVGVLDVSSVRAATSRTAHSLYLGAGVRVGVDLRYSDWLALGFGLTFEVPLQHRYYVDDSQVWRTPDVTLGTAASLEVSW